MMGECATMLTNETRWAQSRAAALAAATVLVLAGCAVTQQVPEPAKPTVVRPAPPPVTTPTPDGEVVVAAPRGNPPFYEVLGQRYFVLPTSAGYREQGIASWYGPEFHGQPTSTGETYDMHQLTAAHPTLPLPTEVKVTNLTNGKSVVVLVNDRGPFSKNRIIDLSYAAAKQIDMIGPGTAKVEVTALNVVQRAGPDAAAPVPVAAATVIPPRQMFVQVGAYGERSNAEIMQRRLEGQGLREVHIHYDPDARLHRVRVGPVASADEYDALLARMRKLNIRDTQLVTAPVPN
jgi:rare lipoprotein A